MASTILEQLNQTEITCCVVNPRQVRAFATALGKAKTDALDALVLAQYGQALQPQPRPLPDAQTQKLKALVNVSSG